MGLFRNVTVAIDVCGDDRLVVDEPLLSPASQGALEKATWVARRDGAPLHLLTSLDVDAHAEALIRRDFAAGAEGVLRAAKERVELIASPLRQSGLTVTTDVAFGRASTAVLDDVARNARDLVVVGTRERGAVARNLLGSTSLQLLRRCPVAVWVARRVPSPPIAVVLAPVAPGDMAPQILGVAGSLAATFGARLIVVHAVDPTYGRFLRRGGLSAEVIAERTAEEREEARREIEKLTSESSPEGCEHEVRVAHGEPAEVVLAEAARSHADLVVMGSVVQGPIRGVFLGSTVEKVLPHLATSLLVLKPRDES